MEHRNIKTGRKINFRSKQEIVRLLKEFEMIGILPRLQRSANPMVYPAELFIPGKNICARVNMPLRVSS